MTPRDSRRGRRLALAATVAVRFFAGSLVAQVAPLAVKPPAPAMTIALTGDSIITQRLSPYREPEFLRLIELVRGADVAFTNIEMLFHDYEGYPAVVSGGTYMRAEPAMAKELAWAGFDIGGCANNHTGDYSIEALFTTDRALTEAGIVHAGIGENLQQAREARYADTAAGRVAIVSCSSTFTAHSMAGRQRSDVKGRPGLSPLRFETKYIVDAATLAQLKTLAEKIPTATSEGSARKPVSKSDEVFFQGNRFVLGEKFAMVRTPLKQDIDEITAAIRDAKSMSRHVIVSLHCHEGNPVDRDAPPDFFVAFAHAAVDAGASAVVGEGTACPPRHRDLPGEGHLLQPGGFYLPERHRAPPASGKLREHGTRRGGPRQRLQRQAHGQRYQGLARAARNLGKRGRDAKVRRRKARRAEPVPDYPRVWLALGRPRASDHGLG
jgi:poly-gamma-glutamate capsule biosynthesis protein CapA/YwtB (metallophosphatase superfamily)